MEISQELRGRLLAHQKVEITEYHIYRKLARRVKSPEDSKVLEKIAEDEMRHYDTWRTFTKQDVKPDRFRIWRYFWISRIFGFTFGVKLLESREERAQVNYGRLGGEIAVADEIVREENEHEKALLDLLDEERLRYTGSIVLGLNDALVELTGALAGLTLALQNTQLIALTGSITGVAAALSMGASEYLSTKSEEDESESGDKSKSPFKASFYTGTAYLLTVLLLILPYLVLQNYYLCLAWTLATAIGIIAFFNYYISVAKGVAFKRRFLEMVGLSVGVGGLSFLVGLLLRSVLGVEV